jgi:phosphoserine aminotransferase
MITSKPATRPNNPCFSSGPCAKRPGWTLDGLANAALGRSHRSEAGKAKLREVIERSRAVLGIPRDYRVGIVPASDTGAMELALWSLLGPLGIDVLAWESFGAQWAADISTQLRLDDVRLFDAPYGRLPDLSQVSPERDIVFAWNGTTSGVRVPHGDWIAPDRAGLTLCDATWRCRGTGSM